MPKLTEILERIRDDYPKSPALVDLAQRVADRKIDGSAYMTLPHLLGIVKGRPGEWRGNSGGTPLATHDDHGLVPQGLAEIYQWAEYLASERVGLIESHFELLRDDGSSVLLDDAAVADALESDQLFDPDTGAPVENWRDSVIVYYSLVEGVTADDIELGFRK